MLITLLYYFFALLVIVAAMAILCTSQPFLAAIYLIGIILSLSAIYFLQGASLIAIIQLILHAGGVVVLLICSVSFFNPHASTAKKRTLPYRKIATLGILFLFIGSIGWKFYTVPFPWVPSQVSPTNPVTAISYQLVGPYGLLLELVGILLLITLVGMLYILLKDSR